MSAFVTKRYLASAIRSARPFAGQGNIIDPAAAQVFRALIAGVMDAPEGAGLAQEFRARARAARPTTAPIVNEAYPMDSTARVPEPILRKLPALAEDVEYRAVNADLILWDIHAEIVVDVLPNAFLSPSGTR